jgi:hypothetical protein
MARDRGEGVQEGKANYYGVRARVWGLGSGVLGDWVGERGGSGGEG